jgi:curved DNA-binding protein CbpA
MIDPCSTLGLPPNADEAMVRQRYLELVREFPPDRAPERFAEIRAAYESLRDPVRRLESELFKLDSGTYSLEALNTELRIRLRDARFPASVLAGWTHRS